MTTFAGRTADEWRAEAAKARKRSADSFERWDTDGFLSQWAADQMALSYDDCAKIAESGGRIKVPAVFDLDGEFLSCDYREGAHGWYYLIPDERVTDTIRRFISTSSAQKASARAANNAKKGVSEGTVSVPAYLDSRTGRAMPNIRAAMSGDVETVSTDGYQINDH